MYKTKPRPDGIKKRSEQASQVNSPKHTRSCTNSSQTSVTAGDDFDDERFREDPPAAISLSDLPDDEPGANASSKHSSEHGEFDEFIVHGENEVDVVERGESQSSTICVEEGNLKSGPQEEHEQQADEVVEKQVKKTNRGRKQSAEELRASEGDVDDTEMEKEESDKESSAKKTEKRVSPRRLDKKIEEARPKSKTSSPEMEAEKDRSQSSVQLNEVSKEIDFWVEIDNSQTKRKRSQSNDDSESDKEEEDELEEEVVEEKTSKKRPQGKAAKRVPLKEKSSNVKQATTSKKQEKKPAAKVAKNETKKVTKKEVKKETKKTTKQEGKVEKGGSSTRSGLRRDSQPESPPKLTSRQKTIKATAEEPRSHSGLNLPKRFELHCKKALNACVDDERRWKATNDLLMMVDTLEYYNNLAVPNESKADRLIAMSEALDYRVDNDKVVALMRSSLVFLQQRILLWIAEESDIESTSSGLDKSQARTAVELMVDFVDKHAPDDRWKQLKKVQDFGVNKASKLRDNFQALVASIHAAIETERLEP